MAENQEPSEEPKDLLNAYAGRWIARIGDRVIGQGGTPEQALHAAKSSRFKEKPSIYYVPTLQPPYIHPIVYKIAEIIPPDIPAHLVGGPVRDSLLTRSTYDLDFVLPTDAIPIARKVADTLGGAYYPLDEERNYGRVIVFQPDGKRLILDFTVYQGDTLDDDLRARDFTVNAMALDIRPPFSLFDPLDGVADVRAKVLRACGPNTFINDPIRILRGIRLATALYFHLFAETRLQMRQAIPILPNISPERLRDEIFRILDGPRPDAAVRALDILGALQYTLPELVALKGVAQSPPHISDVWDHTLEVINKLETILDILSLNRDPDKGANLPLGLVILQLGRFREHLQSHLGTFLNPNRPLRPLLFLAALYHDSGKPQTRQPDDQGRIRFFDHERIGTELASQRAHSLQLSNPEIARLKTIVRFHMRPLMLAQGDQLPSRRAIYRFFRDAGPAGVDVCLVSLADMLGTYGPNLPQKEWVKLIEIIRILLEAWWEKPGESVSPTPVVTGHDLMNALKLEPGPLIGQLLEAIREAQAGGSVHNFQEAIDLARNVIAESKDGQ